MSDNNENQTKLFTIGHSTHELPEFVAMLKMHDVSAVADVRSQPYSRFNPQFNREPLRAALEREGILYVFLGVELGARRSERECYEGGKAVYERIARTGAFLEGLARVRSCVVDHRLAIMCAEKDPLTCHRTILICRALRHDAMDIRHILDDGRVESMKDTEDRLLSLVGLPPGDLFRSRDEFLEEAYLRQGDRIAFIESQEPESALR